MQRAQPRIVVKTRSTKAQIMFLAQYMAAHPGFAVGKDPGARETAEEWEYLASALNELGHARTVEQWKVCWRDQKSRARAVGGADGQATTATSNNAAVPFRSNIKKLVLSAISTEMGEGKESQEPQESPICEDNDTEEFKDKHGWNDLDNYSESYMDPLSTRTIKRTKMPVDCQISIDNDNSDPEEDYLPKVWGKKLKTLNPTQKLYAEKAINDILFEAQLENLRYKKDL